MHSLFLGKGRLLRFIKLLAKNKIVINVYFWGFTIMLIN